MKLLRLLLVCMTLISPLVLTVTPTYAQQQGEDNNETYWQSLLRRFRWLGFLERLLEQTAAPGAVNFPLQKFAALTTPSVNGPMTPSNYFLLSFWYNSTTPSAFQRIFRAEDPDEVAVAELAFLENDIALTLQVNNGGKFTLVTFTTENAQGLIAPIKFDGRWHNVIVNAHMTGACLSDMTKPCCLTAEYVIDGGNVQSLNAAQTEVISERNTIITDVSGPSFASFGPFVWANASSWTIGGTSSLSFANNIRAQEEATFYHGMLAEFYLQLNDGDTDPPTPLLTDVNRSLILKFIRLNAYANNINASSAGYCASPTGRIPTMCNRGGPATFLVGPNYYLQTVLGADRIQRATSDPCDPANRVANVTGCK